MAEKLPKILAISLNAWRTDSNSHTQTDLFRFWDSDRVAQIYTKSVLPDTPVCHEFFQIAENSVIKSVFNRHPVGCKVVNGGKITSESRKAIEQERKIYAAGHKKRSMFLIIVRELIWLFGNWKTKALDHFIEKTAPDVYFVPIYPVVYMGMIQCHILKKYPRPYVCYLADDNYSYLNCHTPLSYLHRWWLRKYVKKLAVNCSEMFTITQMEAEDTDKLFGTHSTVLTKGIDYTDLTFQEIKSTVPLRMVYTGSLVIGRDFSLAAIARALANINKDGVKITLDIYSPTELPAEIMKLLNSNGSCNHGNIPREQIATIQKSADIVVFAESLEKRYRYAAKLSFSTKLTDYFKSGKCIFAIGDATIAPIKYLMENDAAIIATDYQDVEKILRKLLNDPQLLNYYGKNAFECGRKNHNIDLIRSRFISTLISAYKKGVPDGKAKNISAF